MKTYCLTIDDGPTSDTIDKLQILEKNNTKAIWFCLGKNLQEHSQIAIELIRRGHIIGNHSFSHPFFSRIPFSACVNEIYQTEEIINQIYSKSGITRKGKFFRFPYGDRGDLINDKYSTKPTSALHKNKLQFFLKEFGFNSSNIFLAGHKNDNSKHSNGFDWLWSYDVREWAVNHKNQKYQLAYSKVKESLNNYLQDDQRQNQIILLHDNGRNEQYFGELMKVFYDNGITFALPRFE